MTDRELMQQALDCLLAWKEESSGYGWSISDQECVEALRARLAQPEPEPVACDCDSPAWCKQYKKCHRAMLGFEPYVAPPQREWQGLTDEEIGDIIEASQITLKNYCSEDKQTEYARAIEAKLRVKNT
jgi:hypothetical protein